MRSMLFGFLIATVASSSAIAQDVTMTMGDLVSLRAGNDVQGKSRDAFLLQLEDSTVHVMEATVIDYGTSDSKFIVAVGLLTSAYMACVQSSKEARATAIASVTQLGDYNVTGKFDRFQDDTTQSSMGNYGTLILTECSFERLP